MFVVIQHNITNPKLWDEVTKQLEPLIDSGKLPTGIKPYFYLPSTDGRHAECLWEAGSVNELKRFLDPYTAQAARNEYFQVNTEMAFGLPQFKHEHAEAHH